MIANRIGIKSFAESHRVKIRQDSCGDLVISGKQHTDDMPVQIEYCSHIFDCEDGHHLGVCLMFAPSGDGKSGKSAKWVNARKKLIAAGFTIHQDGDAEGIALFDPSNNAQAKLALRLAGVKTRRQLAPEEAAAVAARLAAARAAKAIQALV